MTSPETKSIQYHLMELDIAKNLDDARRILPPVLESDRTILDIGCGIGQSFLVLDCTGRTCVGIDVDAEAIAYGAAHYGDVLHYVVSDASQLPLQDETFDFVFSRVSLPYTNIPRVVREIHRVLRPGGRVWLTIHTRPIALRHLRGAFKFPFNARTIIHGIYVLINGYILKHFGVVVPFINGKYESWQDIPTMKQLMSQHGFEVRCFTTPMHAGLEGSRKS